MTWRTWLYQAVPETGLICGGGSREKISTLADQHHVVVHSYFIHAKKLTPYTFAGNVEAGHRLVLAHTDSEGEALIGVYVVVEATDVGLPLLSEANVLKGTGHEPGECWATVPAELLSGTDFPVDPYLRVHCGIAVQRIHRAMVSPEARRNAMKRRAQPRQSLNVWPLSGEDIRMPD